MNRAAALVIVAVIARMAAAAPATTELLDQLGAASQADVERAIAAVAQLPAADPDILFAAARACDDRLVDLGCALAFYERVLAEHPSARVAGAATQRATALRTLVGPRGEHIALARALIGLRARADDAQPGEVIAEGDRLAGASWTGAPVAALWLADWLRRSGRLADADTRYATVQARWPGSPEARDALRGRAGCALDAGDFARAAELARQLPSTDPADAAVRDDFVHSVARGRLRALGYTAAWLAFTGALAALAASLIVLVGRAPRGARLHALRPPIEVYFLAPVAAVLIGVALTTNRLIAPAVALIVTGGLALAWLSGAVLDQLRATDASPRRVRLRAVVHAILCVVGVAALGYIALMRNHLLDALIETVRFGPER